MKKLISIMIIIISIIILLYSSFLIKAGKGYEKPNFEVNSGVKNFEIGENFEIIKKDDSKLKLDYINNSDRILSFDSNYKVNQNEINIEKGNYLFNFNTLNNKYTVKSDSFYLELESPSSVFINNSENNIKIISIDNIIKLTFLNIKTSEVLNTSFLYPNQYVVFDGNKNFLIKNADLFRITQIISLGYFSENILLNEKINPDFKKIFFTKDGKIISELENLFLYIYADFLEKKKIIDGFNDKRFFEENENSLTNRYKNLLLNKNKKAIFLKNTILKEIKDILNDKKNISIKGPELKENIENLKNLSEDEQKDILNTIKFFSSYINTNRKYDNDLKIFFEKILNPSFEVVTKSENLDLNATFFNYNFSKNETFYSEIKDYIEKRASDKTEDDEQNYFLFFLNKLILANLKDKNTNFEDTIIIFKNFTDIGVKYYSMENEKNEILKEKMIETGLVNFEGIINNILINLEKNYFKKNQNGILTQISGKSLEKKFVDTFSRSIKKVYSDYYELNKNILGTSSLVQNYDNNYKKFEELELALSDFEKYLIQYDGKNSILLNNSFENNNEETLSKEKATKFLNKFNGIVFNDSNIEIMGEKFCSNPNSDNFKSLKENPSCYKISDITVGNGVNVGFILYPKDFNKISNIEIGKNKNINRGTYKVDILEEQYKNGASSRGDGEALKFEDFFTDIIIGSGQNISENIETFEEINKNIDTESPIIRTFKNTILLGNNGTLTKLNSFLKIEYNDLIVKETEDGKQYVINIENADITIKGKDTQYSGIFSSSYRYNSGKTNSFFNPEIVFSNQGGDDQLLGEKLKISGFIDLTKFSEISSKIGNNIKNIGNIVKYIKNNNNSSLNIVYFPTNDKFQITGENVRFVSVGENIEEFILSGKKVLENNEKIYNIENIIN